MRILRFKEKKQIKKKLKIEFSLFSRWSEKLDQFSLGLARADGTTDQRTLTRDLG